MRFRNLALGLGIAGASMFVYGMLSESNRLKLERRTLRLPLWPKNLSGFRIGLLTDFHIRGPWSMDLSRKAVAMILEEETDVIVLAGDLLDYWREDSDLLLFDALERLGHRKGDVIAVPGNHDYFLGDATGLHRALDPLGIRLLRNEVLELKGVSWVGIDSALEARADPAGAMNAVERFPAVAVWHEGDLVNRMPSGCALMLSGHSHGGQFRIPGVIRPYGHPVLGNRFVEGFYAKTRTPLYVSRGIGTTGPPSRFMCPPEVTVLTLEPTNC